MIISYSKLIGLPIMSLSSQSKIGEISDIIFEPDLSIAAIALKCGWFQDQEIISSIDIVQLLKDGIIVCSDDSVVSVADIIKVKKLADSHYYGTNQTVVSRDGKILGKVHDFLVESETLSVTKICIHGFLNEKVLSTKSIESFNGKRIIVKEQSEKVKFKQKLEETVIAN